MAKAKHIAIRNFEKFLAENRPYLLAQWKDNPEQIKKAIKLFESDVKKDPETHDGTDPYFESKINLYCKELIAGIRKTIYAPEEIDKKADEKPKETTEKEEPLRKCKFCQGNIPRRSKAEFCSNNCAAKHRYYEKKKKLDKAPKERFCVECNKSLGVDQRKKYCGTICRNKAMTRKQNEKPVSSKGNSIEEECKDPLFCHTCKNEITNAPIILDGNAICNICAAEIKQKHNNKPVEIGADGYNKQDNHSEDKEESFVFCFQCGARPSPENPISVSNSLCKECQDPEKLFDKSKVDIHVKGIKPKTIRDKERIVEILDGINRYIDAQLPIPIQWVIEYNELITKI